MNNLLRAPRRSVRLMIPRLLIDEHERAHHASNIRATVLGAAPDHLQNPTVPFDRQLRLVAELLLNTEIAGSRISVAETPGNIAARYGAYRGIVVINHPDAVIPTYTGDRFAGLKVSRWDHLWSPPPGFEAPGNAIADLEVPGTLAELHDRFVANIEVLSGRHVVATGDVVVPPLYGTAALTVHIPEGVRVHALARCAGHNEFIDAGSYVTAMRVRHLHTA